jgi:hypothetical protein
MKKIFLATMLLASTVCGSCTVKVVDGEADAKKVTKTLKLKDFDAIEINGSGKVEFSQAPEYKVQLIASEESMKGVKASVVGKVLTLSRDNSRVNGNKIVQLKMSRGGYTLKVSAPSLSAIRITGSGEFTAKTPITAKSLDAEVTGSGDLDLDNVTADNISVTVTGSGDADIHATCSTMADLMVVGSGDIDADINGCATVKASVGGSGDIDMDLKKCESISAEVTGSGDIEAELVDCGTVDASTSGSGDIVLKGQAKGITKTGKGIDAKGLTIKK